MSRRSFVCFHFGVPAAVSSVLKHEKIDSTWNIMKSHAQTGLCRNFSSAEISPRGEDLLWRSWWKFSPFFRRLIVVNRKYCRMSTRSSAELLLRGNLLSSFPASLFNDSLFLSWLNTLKNFLSQKVLNFSFCQLLTSNEIPFQSHPTPSTRTTQLENLSSEARINRPWSKRRVREFPLSPESILNNKFMLC